MSDSTESGTAEQYYGVGVAITRNSLGRANIYPEDQAERSPSAIPGFDDVEEPVRTTHLIERGEKAVEAATDAIAKQIGISAKRIALAIGAQMGSSSPGDLGLESVEVSFGITLAAGIQAMFTTQSESKVQVTITINYNSPREATP